eukprot:TRINITY_DN9744_c0_g1_i1.p1 TRINITY_DN9744_c0_g1~~TRINITY_DN9744_c0_g1_i1.p1  ORF type:complete len:326 (-),score=27.87 TRINITY_DN9744_c0_g1_i1:28-1005(-)
MIPSYHSQDIDMLALEIQRKCYSDLIENLNHSATYFAQLNPDTNENIYEIFCTGNVYIIQVVLYVVHIPLLVATIHRIVLFFKYRDGLSYISLSLPIIVVSLVIRMGVTILDPGFSCYRIVSPVVSTTFFSFPGGIILGAASFSILYWLELFQESKVGKSITSIKRLKPLLIGIGTYTLFIEVLKSFFVYFGIITPFLTVGFISLYLLIIVFVITLLIYNLKEMYNSINEPTTNENNLTVIKHLFKWLLVLTSGLVCILLSVVIFINTMTWVVDPTAQTLLTYGTFIGDYLIQMGVVFTFKTKTLKGSVFTKTTKNKSMGIELTK